MVITLSKENFFWLGIFTKKWEKWMKWTEHMEEKQEVGGISPFCLDHLVDASGREGCSAPMCCSIHCFEVQSIQNIWTTSKSPAKICSLVQWIVSSFGYWIRRSFLYGSSHVPCNTPWWRSYLCPCCCLQPSLLALLSPVSLHQQLAKLCHFLLPLMWRVWGNLVFGYWNGIIRLIS